MNTKIEGGKSVEGMKHAAGMQRTGIIGLGNIGGPMLQGLLASGLVHPQDLSINNKNAARTQEKITGLSIYDELMVAETSEQVLHASDVIIVALKQDAMQIELDRWKREGLLRPNQCIISLAAGIRMDTIKKWVGNASQPVIRAMTNTAVSVGQGNTGWTASDEITQGQRKYLKHLFGSLGFETYYESESGVDAHTAQHGSGPALYYYLAEAKIEKAISAGSSIEDAIQAELRTFLGAARRIAEKGGRFGAERKAITSPNGTTDSMIRYLLEHDFAELVAHGIQAAIDRSIAIGEYYDKKEL